VDSLEKRVAELRQYVDFGPDDARSLAAIHDALAPDFARIAQEFYDKTREHEEAHAVFTGEEQIARLQRSMQAWLHRLLGGTYDAAYYAQTERIGEVHVRIGLPQRYMFTAMSRIRLDLDRLIDERAPRERATQTRAALHKALDIELAVMLEAYRAAQAARVERRWAIERNAPALAQADVAAIELTREFVVGLDDRGLIRLFNAGAEATTGYGREEMIGRELTTALLAEESREAIAKILAVPPTNDPQRFRVDAFVRTRAGKLRDVRWDIATTRIGDVHVCLIGHDYTEEKKLAERSRRAEKLAAVGTLAAGLAHEIRNPLNGAQLHVAYLQRTLKRAGSSSEMLEAADVISDEIKRLATLVTEFLDFARPNPLERKVSSLGGLIERAATVIEPEANAGNVRIARDFPSKDIVAEVDGPKIEQVVLNLARNAIEALDGQGGGHVTIRLRRQPKNALIEVEDDGPGLPSEDAPIFDAFYTTKPTGTGLGLAITHRIVTDHDGTIEVDSRPGRTLFRVMLPLQAPPERTSS
jgi:PAS domain S-box-containing protein